MGPVRRLAFIYDDHVGLKHTFRILARDRTTHGGLGPAITVFTLNGVSSRIFSTAFQGGRH
jgi:hypothetical protein